MNKCETCIHNKYNEIVNTTYCELSVLPTKPYQPACLRYVNATEELHRREERETRKVNVVLTLMMDAMAVSMQLLKYYESKVDFFGCSKDWAQIKRRAMFKMKEFATQIKVLYNRHFEPDVVKVTKGETKEESADRYDFVAEDVLELCRFLLLYADRCFESQENMKKVEEFLKSLPGRDIIDDNDLKRFFLNKEK